MKRNKFDVFVDVILWLILCSIGCSVLGDLINFIMSWR